MDQKKMNPTTGEDESTLDQTEDALVGTHPKQPHANPAKEREGEHPDESRPFMKSP
jgi:hypothetical protein